MQTSNLITAEREASPTVVRLAQRYRGGAALAVASDVMTVKQLRPLRAVASASVVLS